MLVGGCVQRVGLSSKQCEVDSESSELRLQSVLKVIGEELQGWWRMD
jgi:hypothetical protein